MRSGYWRFFERPVRRDPLWLAAIVVGPVVGVALGVLRSIRSGFDLLYFVAIVVATTIFVVFWLFGLGGGLIRQYLRGRRTR